MAATIGRPQDLQAQIITPGPTPYAASVLSKPEVYPSLYWNERKAGEPFFLATEEEITLAAGATGNTRLVSTQDYWYKIDMFIVSIVPSAGAQVGVASLNYPMSIKTQLSSGDYSPFPNFVPLFGAAGDGRDMRQTLPVPFVLKPNMNMQITFRNDATQSLRVHFQARCARVLSTQGR